MTKRLPPASVIFFRFLILFCIGAVSASSLSEACAGQSEKVKTESELHLGLSESAFNTISETLNLGSHNAERTDFYFDVHNQGRFQLRRGIPAAKLRIQIRPNELIMQKSWIKDQREHTSNDFTWMATTRTSANTKHSSETSNSERIRFSLALLQDIVRANGATSEQREPLAAAWSKTKWPKLKEFDQAIKALPEEFIPAALVLKQRWIVEFQSPSGETVEVQLGRDSDVLGKGRPVSFEIESEVKSDSPEKIAETAQAISSWLISMGIEPTETSPRSSFDFFGRLERLYRF